MNLVAARHLELISTRFNLENLVGQMLQESIYQSMMVRFTSGGNFWAPC